MSFALYLKIRNNSKTFQRLFGLSVEEFDKILQELEPKWHSSILSSYKRPGRDYKLDLSDMLLMLLLYYRSYVTQVFVGYMFGIDDSRVCRIIRRLEPLLADVVKLSKVKTLSQEEVENLIIDATEQAIERPKKGQKPYYSGKKKKHTLKTEIRITQKGRIVQISKSYPGSVHDFTIFKEGELPPSGTQVFVDSGYQGIADIHPASEFPYKSTKNNPLGQEEKEYNTALSRLRVTVEHIFGDLKTFKILSENYRNKRKRYHLKFNIIAGIVNLKNGFAAF
jgi:hypothetical protein